MSWYVTVTSRYCTFLQRENSRLRTGVLPGGALVYSRHWEYPFQLCAGYKIWERQKMAYAEAVFSLN
jgi:hypothetical protein